MRSLSGDVFSAHQQRLALLDDVRGEFDPGHRGAVTRHMDCSGGNEEDVAGVQRHSLSPLYLGLKDARWDVDQLLARMTMPWRDSTGREINSRLVLFIECRNTAIIAIKFDRVVLPAKLDLPKSVGRRKRNVIFIIIRGNASIARDNCTFLTYRTNNVHHLGPCH